MFTGIVEAQGVVKDLTKEKNLFVLKISASKIFKGTKKGDSICVNGVCLTVSSIQQKKLSFDIMRETILRTGLKNLKKRDSVNLERALTARSRFGGHFVTGHVDDVGVITACIKQKNYVEQRVHIHPKLMRFIVPKGSVCIEGVSLTVGEVKKDYFSVYLIPFTLRYTTLGVKKSGDTVNVEVDILARYVLK